MSRETMNIVRHYVNEVYNKGSLDLLEKLVTEDYVNHTELFEVEGMGGLREFVTAMRTAMPDMVQTIHDQLANGDLEVHRYTINGTHQGEWLGIPASGNPLTLEGMTLTRVRDGKIAEEWSYTHTMTALAQMGAIPPEMMPG